MATKVLLLQDVEPQGRAGEIISVKPGFARNFLIPMGFAEAATERALRKQAQLQEQRRQQSIVDSKESQAIAEKIEGTTINKVVKVDQEGHMYGSVTAADIIELLLDQAQVEIEKKSLQLKHPIKATGVHTMTLKLKEGVTASFNLKVMSEEGFKATLV